MLVQVHAVPDAAVRLLVHPAVGADRRPRDDRHPDAHQRTHRDAGVRHLPLPRRGAAARVRRRGGRGPVPVRGERAGVLEPARGGAPARHPGRVAHDVRPPRPAVDPRAQGRDLQLRLLRPAAHRAERVFRVPLRPEGLAPAEPGVLQDGGLHRPGHRLRADGGLAGAGRLGAGVRSPGRGARLPAGRRARTCSSSRRSTS